MCFRCHFLTSSIWQAKERARFITCLIVHFFVCPKKRTKERAAYHLFRFQRNSLRYSLKADASECRTPLGVFIPPCGVFGRGVFLLFSSLLGCVKWLEKHSWQALAFRKVFFCKLPTELFNLCPFACLPKQNLFYADGCRHLQAAPVSDLRPGIFCWCENLSGGSFFHRTGSGRL